MNFPAILNFCLLLASLAFATAFVVGKMKKNIRSGLGLFQGRLLGGQLNIATSNNPIFSLRFFGSRFARTGNNPRASHETVTVRVAGTPPTPLPPPRTPNKPPPPTARPPPPPPPQTPAQPPLNSPTPPQTAPAPRPPTPRPHPTPPPAPPPNAPQPARPRTPPPLPNPHQDATPCGRPTRTGPWHDGRGGQTATPTLAKDHALDPRQHIRLGTRTHMAQDGGGRSSSDGSGHRDP